MWQTNSTIYKLKPRLFYKFAHFQAHLIDFHLQCELYLTIVNFITKLPLVVRKNAILVVCDKLSKIVYFIATTEETLAK